jgi:uncharacterized protein YcfJ
MKAIFAIVMGAVSLPVLAQQHNLHHGIDAAVVVKTEPRYITTYQKRCRQVQVQENNSSVGTVIGAVAGGIIGHQVGKGSGKDAATIAGTIVGGAVGNRIGSDQQNSTVKEQCDTVPVSVANGRTVTFNYQGTLFTVTFDK